MDENINFDDIKGIVRTLERYFNNLIFNNPNLFYSPTKKNGWNTVKISTVIIILLSMLIGFGIACAIFYNGNEQENVLYILTQLVIGIILPSFLFLLGKREITSFTLILALGIIITITVGGTLLQDRYSKYFPRILPFVNFGVLIFIYVILFSTLVYSKNLKDSICERIESLKLQLSKINENQIQNSHSKIEKEIESLRFTINYSTGNCKELLDKQASSLLDLFKLELLTNSRNGINLIENYNFIDLPQNIINEIKNTNSEYKHIAIIGDLSFLSTENGVAMLIESINESDKIFYLYFTGKPKEGNNKVLVSDPCDNLIKKIAKKITNNDKTKISSNLRLLPIIKDESFVGIGFIAFGREMNVYEKVYSYVSSSITGEKEDISRSNPFVLSWKEKTDKFNKFVETLQCGEDTKVSIDKVGDIKYDEIWDKILNIRRKK